MSSPLAVRVDQQQGTGAPIAVQPGAGSLLAVEAQQSGTTLAIQPGAGSTLLAEQVGVQSAAVPGVVG